MPFPSGPYGGSIRYFADKQMRRASPEFKTGPIAALAPGEKPLQIKRSARA
jgi:hypothetical protein